jgi:hypothetical protein
MLRRSLLLSRLAERQRCGNQQAVTHSKDNPSGRSTQTMVSFYPSHRLDIDREINRKVRTKTSTNETRTNRLAPIGSILVAVDLSARFEATAFYAAAIAKNFDARLTIVHVYAPVPLCDFAQIKKPMQEINSTCQRYLEEQRELLFDGYFEKHRNSELLSCRTTEGVEVVFCPSDHSGVWAGLIVKGSLGERTQLTLEGIAKAKGLI